MRGCEDGWVLIGGEGWRDGWMDCVDWDWDWIGIGLDCHELSWIVMDSQLTVLLYV